MNESVRINISIKLIFIPTDSFFNCEKQDKSLSKDPDKWGKKQMYRCEGLFI